MLDEVERFVSLKKRDSQSNNGSYGKNVRELQTQLEVAYGQVCVHGHEECDSTALLETALWSA